MIHLDYINRHEIQIIKRYNNNKIGAKIAYGAASRQRDHRSHGRQ